MCYLSSQKSLASSSVCVCECFVRLVGRCVQPPSVSVHTSSPALQRNHISILRGRKMRKGFPVKHHAKQHRVEEGSDKPNLSSHCALLTLHCLNEAVCKQQWQHSLCCAHWAQCGVLERAPSSPTSMSRVDDKEPQPSRALLWVFWRLGVVTTKIPSFMFIPSAFLSVLFQPLLLQSFLWTVSDVHLIHSKWAFSAQTLRLIFTEEQQNLWWGSTCCTHTMTAHCALKLTVCCRLNSNLHVPRLTLSQAAAAGYVPHCVSSTL